MKIRFRKKRLQLQRRRRFNFFKDILKGLEQAKAGQLTAYRFSSEDRAWLDMRPVGREFGASTL